MQLSEEIKKQILDEFINKFVRISDQKYQERVWIRGEGPECDDFDETVCQFFDVGDPVLEDYENFGITDSQYQLLTKFRNEFRAFSRGTGRNYQPEEFIFGPEWGKIVEMAKVILKAFNHG